MVRLTYCFLSVLVRALLSQPAPSRRSTCRGRCRQRIDRGDLRIGITTPGESDYKITKWYHPACFPFPRKLRQSGVSEEDFVEHHVTDTSPDGSVLPARRQEVVEGLRDRDQPPRAGAARGGDGNDTKGQDKLGKIEQLYMGKQKEKGKEPKAKNTKSDDQALAEAYEHYRDMKVVDLKRVLWWNHQPQTGSKDALRLRALDGHVHGRLARCARCDGGYLRLHEDGTTVTCAGAFDKARQRRIPCDYRGTAAGCPRWQPWYSEEPTPEQDLEMRRLTEEAEDEARPIPANDLSLRKLAKKVRNIDPLSAQGVRKATDQVLELLKQNEPPIDLPADEGDAKRAVGGLVATQPSVALADLAPDIARQFGFKQDDEVAARRKREAQRSNVRCKANAPLVGAFQEVVDLYSKEGDRRVASVFSRVLQALHDLDYPVTEENALGLGRGRHKVPGIGAKSAHYIHEFVRTGSMAKLEAKRASMNE